MPNRSPRTRAETKLLRSSSIRKTLHGPDHSEQLYLALIAGTLWFLNVSEMLQLLGTCRTLREDKSLGIMALSNCKMGVHLLHGCSSDWMNLLLQKQCDPNREKSDFWSECKEHNCNARKMEQNGHLMQDKVPLRYAEGQAAQLLSLLGQMELRFKPFYSRAYVASPFGEFRRARPVIVPLPAPSNKAKGAVWTKGEARSALNAISDGLGDDFVASNNDRIHESEVGMHWENIKMAKRGVKPKCNFCFAAKKAVRDYRKVAKSLLNEFLSVLKKKQMEWRAQGLDEDEMHERRSILKAEMFPEDSYPDVNAAQSTADDILAHICEHNQFPMIPFKGIARCDRNNDDIFNALAVECQDLCESFYQPLKHNLAALVPLCGQRLHRSWMDSHDEVASIRRELIAGISCNGFLVGIYIMKAVE